MPKKCSFVKIKLLFATQVVTERKRDRERQKDRKTERQKDRKTETKRQRESES